MFKKKLTQKAIAALMCTVAMPAVTFAIDQQTNQVFQAQGGCGGDAEPTTPTTPQDPNKTHSPTQDQDSTHKSSHSCGAASNPSSHSCGAASNPTQHSCGAVSSTTTTPGTTNTMNGTHSATNIHDANNHHSSYSGTSTGPGVNSGYASTPSGNYKVEDKPEVNRNATSENR